jgi:hypothetical protein
LLEANLYSDFGVIAKNFPSVPVILTEYYNPLPSTLPSTNPDSICHDTVLGYALYLYGIEKETKAAIETLATHDAGGAAQSYFSNILTNESVLEDQLNNTLGNAALSAVPEDVQVTTVQLDFSNTNPVDFTDHDLCEDYPGGNRGWVFAPGISAAASWGSFTQNYDFTPTDSCARVTTTGGCVYISETPKPGKALGVKYTLTAVLQVNDVPHPTAAGQTAIADEILPTATSLVNSG